MNEAAGSSIWSQLSNAFAQTLESVQQSIVAVHAGRYGTVTGVVWRPGVVVTVRQGIRRSEGIRVIPAGETVSATLAGVDAGTDLAVLRIAAESLPAVESSSAEQARVGDVVLSVSRSRLGDVSASAGIVARLGAPWRTWKGGHMDRLIRPDVRLYVGQSGSALVSEGGRVLGINSTALARDAVITVPKETVDRVVDAILERGHVPKPFLGLAVQAVPVPEGMRAHFPEKVRQALLATHLEPNAPAEQANMLVGDLLVSLDGRSFESVREFLHRLTQLSVGQTVALVVIRGGNTVELTLTVGDRG